MNQKTPVICAKFLVLIMSVSWLVSCKIKILADSFPISRFYEVRLSEPNVVLPTEQALRIAQNVFESEQYECTFHGFEWVYPYMCEHPHNELYIQYKIEDGYLEYNLRSNFMGDTRNADERFDAGANALQARFLEENLRATQI